MSVVVLNADLERLHVVSVPHAIRMLVRKVAVIEEGDLERLIGPYPWPHVLRLVRYVYMKWMHAPAHFTRIGVLRRDRFRCAYCNKPANTMDHVLPESRGGATSWLNCVASCSPCNNRKNNRTPAEAGMRLMVEPWVPDRVSLVSAAVV